MTLPPRPPRSPGERGFALLLVLLLSSIVIVLVGDLAYQSSLEELAAENVSDQTVIEYSIDGQLELALAHLNFDKKQNGDVDSEFDDWGRKELKQRTDDKVALTTSIVDECGKFNLVRLTTGAEAQQARAREIFVRILDRFRQDSSDDMSSGAAQDLADRIIAYLKRDATAVGGVPRPKTSTPGVPMLLDELVFVDPKKMPGLLIDQQTKEKPAAGLYRFVTVFGAGKVNLNTAPLTVLQAFFADNRDRDIPQAIINRRNKAPTDTGTSGMSGTSSMSTPSSGTTNENGEPQGNPFSDVNQLTDGSVEGLTLEVLQRNNVDVPVDFDVKSDFFSVRISGETQRTRRMELYVLERVATEGFRFLLHQERTDPVLEIADDTSPR